MESLFNQPHELVAIMGFFLCVILSAVFSGCETAITSLGTLKARHLLETRGGDASPIQLWLNYPGRVLTTLLLFNTSVNILASSIATELATKYFHNQAMAIATGVTTFLVLVFGEIFPKTFSKTHADYLAIPALYLIQFMYRLCFPLIWVLSMITDNLIKSFGGPRKQIPPITEEELEYLVDVGEKAGVFEETKKDMISGVFGFDETKVREIMTPRTDIVAIDIQGSLMDAFRQVVNSGHSRIPVYEERIDNIVGVLFAKDLLKLSLSSGNAPAPSIVDLMRKPYQIPESKPIMDVFKELKKSKNHMAIVIDEYGGTAGIVTLEDILEEIVGEIQDEHDQEEAKIVEIEPGVYHISGMLNIDEFLEFFNLEEQNVLGDGEHEADTLAGYLIQAVGDLPQPGHQIKIGPLTVEVIGVERHRIEKVQVRRTPEVASRGPRPDDIKNSGGEHG